MPPTSQNASPQRAAGKIRPQIERILPLSRAAQAHELVEQGLSQGKIVLDPTLDR